MSTIIKVDWSLLATIVPTSHVKQIADLVKQGKLPTRPEAKEMDDENFVRVNGYFKILETAKADVERAASKKTVFQYESKECKLTNISINYDNHIPTITFQEV